MTTKLVAAKIWTEWCRSYIHGRRPKVTSKCVLKVLPSQQKWVQRTMKFWREVRIYWGLTLWPIASRKINKSRVWYRRLRSWKTLSTQTILIVRIIETNLHIPNQRSMEISCLQVTSMSHHRSHLNVFLWRWMQLNQIHNYSARGDKRLNKHQVQRNSQETKRLMLNWWLIHRAWKPLCMRREETSSTTPRKYKENI